MFDFKPDEEEVYLADDHVFKMISRIRANNEEITLTWNTQIRYGDNLRCLHPF